MSGSTPLTCAWPPRPPLAPHLALPNRVLGGGACVTQPLGLPYGHACATILLCDLSRRAARALTSHASRRGSLLASTRRACSGDLGLAFCAFGNEKQHFGTTTHQKLCERPGRGPASLKRGGNARAADRLSSHSKIVAQSSGACEVVLCTPHRRAHDFAKRGEAQEGSRGTRTRSGVEPDMSIEAIL